MSRKILQAVAENVKSVQNAPNSDYIADLEFTIFNFLQHHL